MPTVDARNAPILLPIDVQMGFDFEPWPRRAPADMESNGQALLSYWRSQQWPMIHIRHSSKNPASPLFPGHQGFAFRTGFEPIAEEPVVTKNVNSAFFGTDLETQLRELGPRPLVMFGVSGDMCVSTTARIGANLGFDVTVVSDACWCFDLPGQNGVTIAAEDILAAHMATLAFEFCKVATTRQLIADLKD